jgi:DNA-directed RNA polymerase subunit H (RpoH/RPB5)
MRPKIKELLKQLEIKTKKLPTVKVDKPAPVKYHTTTASS